MTKKITKLMLNWQEYEIREYVEPESEEDEEEEPWE